MIKSITSELNLAAFQCDSSRIIDCPSDVILWTTFGCTLNDVCFYLLFLKNQLRTLIRGIPGAYYRQIEWPIKIYGSISLYHLFARVINPLYIRRQYLSQNIFSHFSSGYQYCPKANTHYKKFYISLSLFHTLMIYFKSQN